jgi:predicted nucleic acid-binding protein
MGVARGSFGQGGRSARGFSLGVHEFVSPDFFTVEAAHSLTRAERQGRILARQARRLFLDILATSPAFHAFQPFMLRAIDISSKLRIGVYDCVYVALAESEQCEFITADERLVKNIQAVFPFVLFLGNMP